MNKMPKNIDLNESDEQRVDSDRKYVSVVEEMRRHSRLSRNIKNKYRDKSKLFADLIVVLRKQYNAPKKDFTEIDSLFNVNKVPYKIVKYEEGNIFEIEANFREHRYQVIYEIKNSKFSNSFYIKYRDNVKAPKTLFGLQANVVKWNHKREVKKNAKLIKGELNKLK